MGPLDAFWPLLNFFAPALGVGLITAGLAKLVWFRVLRGQSWWRLGLVASAACAVALPAAGCCPPARRGPPGGSSLLSTS